MSQYMKYGDRYTPVSGSTINNYLPVGTYVVKMDPRTETFYLEKVESFSISGKLYGDTEKNAERILQTFKDRPYATGVMLNGFKGSGKSLLAKQISIMAAKSGFPTIIVNSPFVGDEFNTFIQSISERCVVFFDEFEKVYSNNEQEHILTLLDGTSPSQKLYILTCNDRSRVNDHMVNRPGRIYYYINFGRISSDQVRNYCLDNLSNKDYIESVVKFTQKFVVFSFDMIAALVEEMNRYGETVTESAKFLNVQLAFDVGRIFHVNAMKLNSKENVPLYNSVVKQNPPTELDSRTLEIYIKDGGSIYLESSQLVEETDNLYVYETERFRVELRQAQNSF